MMVSGPLRSFEGTSIVELDPVLVCQMNASAAHRISQITKIINA
jgi:hypothetical protein